jgi:uncharacterized protein
MMKSPQATISDEEAPMSTLPRPTADAERIHALDAIRGVAILGVLVAYTVWSLGNPPESAWTTDDRWVARGVDLFVDNKFISLFACLFGLGVAGQWRRWEALGHDVTGLHVRRMAFLLAIGLAHGIFVRNGDILAPYALLGFVLLAFRRASTRTMAIAAGILVLTPYAAQFVIAQLRLPWPTRPTGAGGSYFFENLAWLTYWYETNPFLSWPRVLALMLVGILLGRARLVERLAADARFARRALLISLPLAVVSRLAVDRAPSPSSLVESVLVNFLFQVSSWMLATTYATLLFLLMQRPAVSAAVWPLRAMGRMAFTNYLLQSIIVVSICLAFGLFDTIAPGRGLLIAVAVAMIQMPLSAWWLRRRAMGPFERLWRSVTYGRQPLARAEGAL